MDDNISRAMSGVRHCDAVDNGDDAVWAVRFASRLRGVAVVQSSDDYVNIRAACAAGAIAWTMLPQAPDPADRSVGKRLWEKSLKRWRHQLKDMAASVQPGRITTLS